ncbi:MAG: hypothetical protein M3N30_04245, partial [Bacteroidota bacterium]|nr:hypothetical protein [Bacteroidota bacterium]
ALDERESSENGKSAAFDRNARIQGIVNGGIFAVLSVAGNLLYRYRYDNDLHLGVRNRDFMNSSILPNNLPFHTRDLF